MMLLTREPIEWLQCDLSDCGDALKQSSHIQQHINFKLVMLGLKKDLADAASIVLQHSGPADQGEIPPVYLKNGPNPNRVCTNVFSCLLFLVIAGGFTYLQVEAFLKGHVEKVATPMDADGHLCGQGALTDYPFIYFTTPQSEYLYRTVCVKQCPTNVTNPSTQPLECSPNSVVKSCNYNPSPTDPGNSVLVYDTQPLGLHICRPVDDNLYAVIRPAIIVGEVESAMSNIYLATPIIVAAAGITFTLALVFTCLLEFLTTFVTWVFLTVYTLFTALLGILLFNAFFKVPIPYFQDASEAYYKQLTDYAPFVLAGAIVFGCLSLYAFFTIIYRFNKIKFMIAIIKLSCKFLWYNKTIIFVPLFSFVLVMAVIALWIVSSVFILSEVRKASKVEGEHIMPYQRLLPSPIVLGKLVLNFLGLIWLRLYILNFGHYLAASTSCLWYFTANQKHYSTKALLWQTFKDGIRYHNGSIAIGSILLFFLEPFAWMFNWVYGYIYKYKYRSNNPLLHYFTKCCLCCCCCCEKWIMYINKQAYTEVYLLSTDFYPSSKTAYYTMKRNNQEFELLTGLGDSFTHFSKMFLFLVTTIACCYYMVEVQPYAQMIWRPLYPALLIGFVSLSTATLFMTQFGQTADSLILAHFTDYEVEKFHFGHNNCGSCPDTIRDTMNHLRNKHKKYFG